MSLKHLVSWCLAVVVLCSTAVAQDLEVKPKPKAGEAEDSSEPKTEDSEDQVPKKNDEEDDAAKRRAARAERSRLRRQKLLQFTKRSDSFVSVFDSVVADVQDSVVEIRDGRNQVALGAIVENDLVLTKASELKGDLNCLLSNGNSVEPTVYGIDPETDLILLKVDSQGLPPVKFAGKTFVPGIGSWLATVDPDKGPLSVGIVSHLPRQIVNNVPNSAIIGIMPVDAEKTGVRINVIFNDSPAFKSGLLVNDVIIAIDDDDMKNAAELKEKLSRFQPGDEIKLTIMRGGEKLEVPIVLGKQRINPMMDRGNRQNRMGSVLSKRRSDFPLALQHDARLNANECGGPVVGLDGKVVGFNIARDGRVSTLVLPNEIVLPIITRLKTGEFLPKMVNQEEIKLIEKRIATIDREIGDLPKEKTEKEIEFSAGSAVESEIRKQIEDFETKLKQLKERHRKQKKSNRAISDSIAELQRKLNQIENNREKLEFDLKRLKTGVR